MIGRNQSRTYRIFGCSALTRLFKSGTHKGCNENLGRIMYPGLMRHISLKYMIGNHDVFETFPV